MEVLDGNAIAGDLFVAFGREMTAAVGRCSGCGTTSAIAELRVYLRGPGAVARCPHCDGVALVVVRGAARLPGFRLSV